MIKKLLLTVSAVVISMVPALAANDSISDQSKSSLFDLSYNATLLDPVNIRILANPYGQYVAEDGAQKSIVESPDVAQTLELIASRGFIERLISEKNNKELLKKLFAIKDSVSPELAAQIKAALSRRSFELREVMDAGFKTDNTHLFIAKVTVSDCIH